MSERVGKLEDVLLSAAEVRDQLMNLTKLFPDFRYSIGTASGAAANLTRQLAEFAKLAHQLDDLMEKEGLTPPPQGG